MCIRGTRSAFGKPIYEGNLTLAAAEGRTPTDEHMYSNPIMFIIITVLNIFASKKMPYQLGTLEKH